MALSDDLKTRALATGTLILHNQSKWYQKGFFKNPLSDSFTYTTSGPASLCASMYRATGTAAYLTTCTECFDYALDNLSPQGYYIDPQSTTSTEALERMLFCANLGWALFILGDTLDLTHRTKWLNALKANVEKLESTGDMIWYQNGNWELTKLRFLYPMILTAKAIGDFAGYARASFMYERAYNNLVSPATTPTPTLPAGDPKWVGYGYVVDTPGSWNDRSDESGHIVEVKLGPPMPNGGAGTSSDDIAPYSTYDGDYTGLQLEHLCCWYVMTREQRALRLLNAVTNKYLSTVDTTTWIGNFAHGSRHNNPGNGIYTPALAVLALLGERLVTGSLAAPFTDTKVLAQWDTMIGPVLQQNPLGNVPIGIARSWGSVLGPILYACEQSAPRL